MITALSRVPYRHSVVFLGSPGLILYRETVSTRMRIQGALPPGMFALSVPLRCGPDTSYWSAPLHESGLPVTMLGGVHAEFSAGQQHLIALVDLELLRECVPDDLMASIERAACQHVVAASGDAVARLGARLNALLDEAQAQRHALHHSHALRAMQQDMLAAFCQSFAPPVSPPRRVGRAIRQRRLNKVFEYLRLADVALVTVADLSAAANLAERTLEYAFREAIGVSPARMNIGNIRVNQPPTGKPAPTMSTASASGRASHRRTGRRVASPRETRARVGRQPRGHVATRGRFGDRSIDFSAMSDQQPPTHVRAGCGGARCPASSINDPRRIASLTQGASGVNSRRPRTRSRRCPRHA